jgi:5-methylcytosine-specific restriction enzyme subunit McrC
VTVRPVLELAEYSEGEVALSAAAERILRAAAGTALTTAPGSAVDRFRIRAGSYVGAISTPHLDVLIRPKVSTSNLLYLLEAGGLPLDLDEHDVNLLDSLDLVPALATLFAAQLDRLVRRGVLSGYFPHAERRFALRGRIDVAAQQRTAGLGLPVACTFDEFSIDTRLNRRVREAVVRLARLPGVLPATAHRLRRYLGAFEGVSELRGTDLAGSHPFSRLDEHYRTIDALAGLVLRNGSVQTRSGQHPVSAFVVNMNSVFERFVTARLMTALAGQLVVDPKRRIDLDHDGLVPGISPDLVLRAPGGGDVLVADIKYKLAVRGFGREADYYQLLAYTAALDLPAGLLVYCRDDGDRPPRHLVVGPRSTRLDTFSLNLAGRPADIDNEIRALADELTRLTTPDPGPVRPVGERVG